MTQKARWLDDGLAPASGELALGRPYGIVGVQARWVPVAAASLAAQVWLDPLASPIPPSRGTELLHVARVSPPPTAAVTTQRIMTSGVLSCGACSAVTNGAGLIAPGPGALATALTGGTAVVAFGAIAAQCMSEYGSYVRIFSALEGAGATPLRWTADLCGVDPIEAYELMGSNPWLFEISNEEVGLLFRLGAPGGRQGGGAVHYLRLGADGAPIGVPRKVGHPADTTVDDGYLPRGVALPRGRVIFTERRGRLGTNTCHALRIMNVDGSGAQDAPWQLPCLNDDGPLRLTSDLELIAIAGGAVLIWSERWGDRSDFIYPGTPYDEGVYATVLTPEGRRGSEVIRVTDAEASTVGVVLDGSGVPVVSIPGRFMPHAAAADSDLTVVWQDARAVAPGPGIYARRLRCEVRAP